MRLTQIVRHNGMVLVDELAYHLNIRTDYFHEAVSEAAKAFCERWPDNTARLAPLISKRGWLTYDSAVDALEMINDRLGMVTCNWTYGRDLDLCLHRHTLGSGSCPYCGPQEFIELGKVAMRGALEGKPDPARGESCNEYAPDPIGAVEVRQEPIITEPPCDLYYVSVDAGGRIFWKVGASTQPLEKRYTKKDYRRMSNRE